MAPADAPRRRLGLALLLGVTATSCSATTDSPDFGTKPHVVLILGDDLGWAQVGFHDTGSDVQTPHMDALAREGLDLRRHYTYKVRVPSCGARSSEPPEERRREGGNAIRARPLDALSSRAPRRYLPSSRSSLTPLHVYNA